MLFYYFCFVFYCDLNKKNYSYTVVLLYFTLYYHTAASTFQMASTSRHSYEYLKLALMLVFALIFSVLDLLHILKMDYIYASVEVKCFAQIYVNPAPFKKKKHFQSLIGKAQTEFVWKTLDHIHTGIFYYLIAIILFRGDYCVFIVPLNIILEPSDVVRMMRVLLAFMGCFNVFCYCVFVISFGREQTKNVRFLNVFFLNLGNELSNMLSNNNMQSFQDVLPSNIYCLWVFVSVPIWFFSSINVKRFIRCIQEYRSSSNVDELIFHA